MAATELNVTVNMSQAVTGIVRQLVQQADIAKLDGIQTRALLREGLDKIETIVDYENAKNVPLDFNLGWRQA